MITLSRPYFWRSIFASPVPSWPSPPASSSALQSTKLKYCIKLTCYQNPRGLRRFGGVEPLHILENSVIFEGSKDSNRLVRQLPQSHDWREREMRRRWKDVDPARDPRRLERRSAEFVYRIGSGVVGERVRPILLARKQRTCNVILPGTARHP